MNPNQRANLDSLVNSLVNSLFRVRRYHALLIGLHEASKTHPEPLKKFPELYDELWRALYDALFAAIGTMIDRKNDVYCLHKLLTDGIRYSGAGEVADMLSVYRQELEAGSNPAVKKLLAWRHNVVAHRTERGADPEFYERNQMDLSEVGEGINYLEQILVKVSWELLSVVHVFDWNMDALQSECEQVIAIVAAAKRA